MLVLFDIDATLITTRGKGLEAMRRAGADTFGEPFDVAHVEASGRLDPLIMRDMVAATVREATPAQMDAFRVAYRARLEEVLEPGVAAPLAGVRELLAALELIDGLVMGLVTGNLPETGLLKLDRAGIDAEVFRVHAWGCDCPHEPPTRDHLPGVALLKYAELQGREADRALTTIVGDTPHDVACAKAHDLRCLAVATGKFDGATLAAAGADLVVDDLSDTRELVSWLTRAL